MQETLEQFVRALRAADVRVSPAEAIDAARAARAVGYADRQLFKDALCVTLAKRLAYRHCRLGSLALGTGSSCASDAQRCGSVRSLALRCRPPRLLKAALPL